MSVPLIFTLPVLSVRFASVLEEWRNERQGICGLGEEGLLSRRERDIGWRKHPRPRPRHLGHAILVQKSPTLVVGSPGGCPVHHRLGEQDDRPGRYVRNDHAGGLFGGLVDLRRQLEITLVAPW